MAWAEKLPSGKYRGLYRDVHGHKRSAGTFTHKARARNAAAAKEEHARRSMLRDPEAYRRPWREWVDLWWPTRQVEVSTAKVDRGRLDRHLMPRWGDVPIGSITRHDVKAWTAQMERDGVGPTTVQRCAHLLSASLTAAVDAEVLDANPSARLKLPGSAKAQERYLTREEYDAILEHLPTTADQLIVNLATNTGLRPGEWAGLHWDRVDLDRGTLRVVETFSELGGFIKAYPKSRKVRDVPLTDNLVDLLREERKTRDVHEGCGVDHAVGKCRSALVLRTHGGSVVRNSNWSPVWRQAVLDAKVGHARPYDMRHTYASWLLQAKVVTIAELSVLMGHASVQTTMIYAHLSESPSEQIKSALAAPRKSHGLRVVR